MPKKLITGVLACLAVAVIVLGGQTAAHADEVDAPVSAAASSVPIRLAPAPTLGPRDWVGPDVSGITITSTATGFDVELDYASVASPTIPNLFYSGFLTLTAFEGTAVTPVPASPVFGERPILWEEPQLGIPAKSSTRQTGHYSQSFTVDRTGPLVVALYKTESCDQPEGSTVGCGGSDSLYASAVLPGAQDHVVDRVAGADRFAVAVNISKLAYPGTAPVVFVATGGNYPDALSAGPAAAHLGGPLLLNTGDSLLPAVRTEIERLDPERIVVVGGVNSIPAAVFSELQGLQPNVTRLGGADRYEASRAIVDFAFRTGGATTAYVATGANFPDALSAGAAAAVQGGPVLLVNGGASSLDAASRATLTGLGVEDVIIAGGPASVSPGVQNDLASVATVARDGGADRFAASVNINARAFPSSSRAFLATGLKFPDALSGSAWAGSLGAPLYVVNTNCVPKATLAAMTAQGVAHVTLLGGTATLTEEVASLTPCSW